MPRALRLLLSSAPFLALFLSAEPAEAQYLYLDSNGDGIHTASDVLSPTGTTTIDVWLRTNTNRDGSAAVCSSGDGELTINSYEFILRATNGTIAWGALTNRQPDFTVSFGQASSANEFYGGFGGGAILPPGTYRLATLEVSVANGTPSLAPVSSSSLSAQHLTSFGSRCSGNELDNTLRLGSDWFDVDGLPYGGDPNQGPTLDQPAPMEVAGGAVAHQTLTATDPDGQPLGFSKVTGPFFMTVTTVNPGTGNASGDVTLAPQQNDIGNTTGVVAVSDGISSDEKSFPITVTFGCGEGFCYEERNLGPLGSPIQVKAGDLNGDSKFDLVTALGGGFFDIRLGRGDGSFEVPTLLGVVALPGRIWDYELADMNGDGRSDIIATTDPNQLLDQYYTIHIFLSSEDGSLIQGPSYQRDPGTLDHFGPSLEAGDLNRDGRADIALPRSGGKVSVFLGNGDGTLGPVADWDGGTFNAASIGIADMNGDGSLDIFRVGSGRLGVLLGRGDGTFEPPATGIGPLNGGFLAAGQIDSDGRADVAISGSGSAFLGGSAISIFMGRSDGTLVSAPPLHVLSAGYRGLSFVDMTQDGVTDAVVSTSGYSGDDRLPPLQARISILVGDGTGAFGDRTDIPAPTTFGFNGMATGDWDADGRTDIAAVFGPVPLIKILLNRGYRPNSDRPLSIYGPTRISPLSEGITSIQSFVADDPDGDPVAFTVDRSGLPPGVLTETLDPGFPWELRLAVTPDFGTEGVYVLTIHASANGSNASWPVEIHVVRGNRPPVADAGGPYEGVVGVPVVFDGTGSSDPDGNPLTYRWFFGDFTSATGAVVSHTFATATTFGVQLTVSDSGDPPRQATDNTIVTIAVALSAEASLVGTSRTIALVGSSRPSSCFQIEASGGGFTPDEVDPTTLRMKYAGGGPVSEISAIADHTVVGGDRDRDGVPDLTACFRREDIRQLLSSVTGRDTVEVTLEGRLTSGALFRATTELVVVAGGGPLSAALAPNPLNPEATLSFVSARTGSVRVRLFDVGGRLVRTLLDGASLPGGYHELKVDGRNSSGGRLASGVYFYRIDASGTVAQGRFAILK